MLPRKVIGKEIETKNECTLQVCMEVARAVCSSSPVCAVRLAACALLPAIAGKRKHLAH